jgi:hypothetical protein
MNKTSKQHCEFLRSQAKRKFDNFRATWIDVLRWTNPHRAQWLLSQTPGDRKNNHIVDATHLLALRSCVAGFSEGNTSATRPWVRLASRDQERNENYENKAWLQHYTQRTMSYLSTSNFYDAAGVFYNDYHIVNTGAHYMEELAAGGFFVHTLIPGSYYVINNAYGEADIMVREFTLNVKSIVDQYGTKDRNGKAVWSNISPSVKKAYEDGNYSLKVDVVQIIQPNPDYDFKNPNAPTNRQWLELTYEVGGGTGHQFAENQDYASNPIGGLNDVYLKRHTRRRKPFIVGKSTNDSEYGEKGPTLDSLGLIKSLNKKAIGKDRALEQILAPTLQGPASLRKSYISNAPNTYIPLDSRSMAAKQKIESVYQINPAIGALLQDVDDMRGQVDKFYFADFLLYLSKNPKTRTAAETNAIVEEQQRIIGPSLQSLNTTYNIPVIEWVMDYVLYEDPYLEPPPPDLEGQSLKPEFVSVFAQAQKAADLPQMDRYAAMIANVAQIDSRILAKFNVDKFADLYEDRLYLPAGLNNPQDKVDAMREQAAKQAQRQQAMQETIPAIASAAKDAASAQRPR